MSQICRSSLTFLLLVTLFFGQVFCINLSQGYHQRQSSTSPQMANSNKKKYSNDWAVEIHGGPNQMADQIAKRNGFFNLGKVTKSLLIFYECKRYIG